MNSFLKAKGGKKTQREKGRERETDQRQAFTQRENLESSSHLYNSKVSNRRIKMQIIKKRQTKMQESLQELAVIIGLDDIGIWGV